MCFPSPSLTQWHPVTLAQWGHPPAIQSSQMLGKDRTPRMSGDPHAAWLWGANQPFPTRPFSEDLSGHEQLTPTFIQALWFSHSEQVRPACSNHHCKIPIPVALCSHRKPSRSECQQNETGPYLERPYQNKVQSGNALLSPRMCKFCSLIPDKIGNFPFQLNTTPWTISASPPYVSLLNVSMTLSKSPKQAIPRHF